MTDGVTGVFPGKRSQDWYHLMLKSWLTFTDGSSVINRRTLAGYPGLCTVCSNRLKPAQTVKLVDVVYVKYS